MLKRAVFILWVSLLAACSASLDQLQQSGVLTASEAPLARGIKEALEISSSRASDQLSQPGGYSQSPLYRITMPESLQTMTGTLRQFGLASQIDQVEALMNKGAEQAAAQAKDLFIEAVRNMSVDDALSIVRGDETAATRYFRNQTERTLRERYQPIIEQNLSQLGFYEQYKGLLNRYQKIPVANKPSLDLEQHALDQSLNALFTQVAAEEKLIRADPVGRGSELIGSVFR